MRRNRIQTVNVSALANAAAGSTEFTLSPDTNYDQIVGVVVFNKGAHTNFDIGLKKHNGEVIQDLVDHSFYQQLNGERYFPVNIEVDSNNIKVVLNLNESQANACNAQVAFVLEKNF